MKYYLSLGSNLGDRRQNLRRALEGLSRLGKIVKSSPVYESEPVDVVDQPLFYNMLCILDAGARPFRLLRKLKALEVRLGRRFSRRRGPRSIDIDIVEYDGDIVQTSVLQIPHQRWEQRKFVLVPFATVAPDFINRRGKTLQRVIETCKDSNELTRVIERI